MRTGTHIKWVEKRSPTKAVGGPEKEKKKKMIKFWKKTGGKEKKTQRGEGAGINGGK